MYCINCGKANDETSRYCIYCGVTLHAPSRDDLPAQKPGGAQGLARKSSRQQNRKWLLGLGIGALFLVFAVYAGRGLQGKTPTQTVEGFLKAINKRDWEKAEEYLFRGRKLDDTYPLVKYAGTIRQVAILNEEIEIGPVTGDKKAKLVVILNPPPGLPLRGNISSEDNIVVEGGEVRVSGKHVIFVIKQRTTYGGLPYPSMEVINPQFIVILHWQDGRWRISTP